MAVIPVHSWEFPFYFIFLFFSLYFIYFISVLILILRKGMPKKKVKIKKKKKKEKEEFQRLEGFDSPIFYSLISRLSHSRLTLSTLSTFSLNSLYFLHNTLYNTLTLPCHVPFGKLDLCCLHLFTSNL